VNWGKACSVGHAWLLIFWRTNEAGIRNLCRGIAIKYGEKLVAGRLGPLQGELVTAQFQVVLIALVDTIYSGLGSK